MDGKKTILGAFVVLLVQIANHFGVSIGDAVMLNDALLTVGGALLAIYGRIVAKKQIGGGFLN